LWGVPSNESTQPPRSKLWEAGTSRNRRNGSSGKFIALLADCNLTRTNKSLSAARVVIWYPGSVLARRATYDSARWRGILIRGMRCQHPPRIYSPAQRVAGDEVGVGNRNSSFSVTRFAFDFTRASEYQ
jgi:hypothetical protein